MNEKLTSSRMKTILIANRGEIALRLIRTVQRMGYRALAVYSEVDAGAPHVRLADAACCIGAGPARDSYLNIDALLAAARSHAADTLHPGYGFLAENADFAQAVQDAGLCWIGPPPQAIRSMGNKAAAKRLLAGSGVPMLPGYQGSAQSDAALLAEAAQIGLPLMIKAAAGGGGRGMRLVLAAGELEAALARARSEAQQAFGSGELILERALVAPRHVEVQVFADSHGNAVHLGERDCSVQRRHQKIIEEAPSPAVDAVLRAQLGAAALQVTRACGYVGAGTIEFLLEQDGAFWFMEMNTRLQVEHPVTEALCGVDLVEWQLRVAAGEPLPLTQSEIDRRLACGGHAIEVRLCAEDPAREFLPQAGQVALWRAAPGIRVEHALEDGQSISPHYDSMVARLIAHAASREEARRLLAQQLGGCVLLGVATNQDFLLDCLDHPDFIAGRANTGFIACSGIPLTQGRSGDWITQVVAAALLLTSRMQSGSPRTPAELSGWSSSAALEMTLEFELDGALCSLLARPDGAGIWCLRARGQAGAEARVVLSNADAKHRSTLQMTVDGAVFTVTPDWIRRDETIYFRQGQRNHCLQDLAKRPPRSKNAASSDGMVRSPMNGRVALAPLQVGQAVQAGQTLLVLEAMKMEHALAAPCSGVLLALHVAAGEQVAPGQLLAEIAPREGARQ